MYDSKQITQLRKSGRLKEAFDLAKRLLNDSPNDEYILNAYAWVLYITQVSTNMQVHVDAWSVNFEIGNDTIEKKWSFTSS